jgi:hypothetical protein
MGGANLWCAGVGRSPTVVHGRALCSGNVGQLWTKSNAAEILEPCEAPVTVWISRRCQTGLTEMVKQSLEHYLRDAGVTCTWLDARYGIAPRSVGPSIAVTSPLFPNGVRVPGIWLHPTTLIVITELSQNRVAGFLGSMAAQAEPLEISFPQPWFRTPALLCEAQRVAGADLVVVLFRVFSEDWCLVAPSAVLADTLIATWAKLRPDDVPHLAAWRRHFLNPQADQWTTWTGTAPDLRRAGYRAGSRVLLDGVAAKIAFVAEVWDDLGRASGNLYRIPSFISKRIRQA